MAATPLTIQILKQLALVLVMALALIAHALVGGGIAHANTLPNPYHAFQLADATPDNQLSLLGDRFRIDDHVDEVTMIFFRDPKSRPVVLILPDGSKWYATRHPAHVQWETGEGFDQVRIEAPMRGPWQVSGALRPESRLMIISDLQFHAEPLPEFIFRGERLPITGSFTEAGEAIEQRDFRSAIELELYLVSTNEEEFENFGLNPRLVGDFLDDGRGLDARGRDGIFTGEVEFKVPSGRYLPSYRAVTPLYQRTFEQQPIQVVELPVKASVQVAEIQDQPHQLQFEINDDYFDRRDLIIRGHVEYPNGERQLIDISTAQGDSLIEHIPNYVHGIFTVRTTLYATTQHDVREIVAQLGELEFTARQPEPPGPTEDELMRQRMAEREAQAIAQVEEHQAAQRRKLWIVVGIVGVNLLLVLGWVAIAWRRHKAK